VDVWDSLSRGEDPTDDPEGGPRPGGAGRGTDRHLTE
jgi:hypothetical protein